MAVILSINGNIDNEIQNLGHEVISKRFAKTGFYSAVDILAECPKPPDFFIQKEQLGIKVILTDVHKLPCRTAFWSIDTHLNYSWQMYYGLLFDVFLTPHKTLVERLPLAWQHPNTHRLAQNGFAHPFVPHSKRKHKINFVGHLKGTRPQRERIAKLLSTKYNVEIINNIFPPEMIKLYADTCIIPNESIANEVNFRILEGASCGACVLSPDVGEDQNILFEPEREVLIYKNLEELEELIDYCIKHPDFCESIAHAAWQRIQKEHTKEHRAAQLLTAIQGTEHTRIKTYEQDIIQFTIAIMDIYNDITLENPKNISRYTYETKAFELLLQIFRLRKNVSKEEQSNTLQALFAKVDEFILTADADIEHKKMLAIACGGIAIEEQDMARCFFYLRLHEKLCAAPAPMHIEQTEAQFAFAWVNALIREQKQVIGGLEYKKGCYRTAFDFATLCREVDPHGTTWIQALAKLDHVLHSFPMKEREEIKSLLA